MSAPTVVEIHKTETGAWGVYIDGRLISDHRLRDGAAIAANAHIKIAREQEDDDG